MSAWVLSVLLQASLMGSGEQSYKEAYHKTASTGQPLVILIGADWCPGCRTMKQSVIPQLARQGDLGKVSFAYINTDQDRALASKLMQGGSIPQLVMFTKTTSGWRRLQLTGAQSVSATQAFINQGLQSPAAELSQR